MRTQIIQLESHDDFISVRDKLNWGKTTRVVLVWPKKGRVLTRRLDLVFLQRYSQTAGMQLGLVCSDPEVKAYAADLGLPVFSHLHNAQRDSWRRGRSQLAQRGKGTAARPIQVVRQARQDLRAFLDKINGAPRPEAVDVSAPRRAVRVTAFVIGMLAVATLVGLFFPGAVIQIQPKRMHQSLVVPVTASEGVQMVSISGSIPAHAVTVVVQSTQQTPATGKKEFPVAFAGGRVQFTNMTDQVVEIPNGTRVLTSGGRGYIVHQSGSLAGEVGRVVVLDVSAEKAGSAGNTGPGTVNSIEGSLGLQVQVTNLLPIGGGTDQQTATAAQADVDLLKSKAAADIQTRALVELTRQLGAGLKLVESTLRMVKTSKERLEPQVGQPTDMVSYMVQQEFHALVLAEEDVRLLGMLSLDANLPAGFQSLPGKSLAVTYSGQPIFDGKNIIWKVQVERDLAASVAEQEVQIQVRGKPAPEAARQIAARFPVDGIPRIRLSPGWWPLLPLYPFRIFLDRQGF
jgi:hypothetical protein